MMAAKIDPVAGTGQGWQQPPQQESAVVPAAATGQVCHQQPHQQGAVVLDSAAATVQNWKQQGAVVPAATATGQSLQRPPPPQGAVVLSATARGEQQQLQQCAIVPAVAHTAQQQPQQQRSITPAATAAVGCQQRPQQQCTIVPAATASSQGWQQPPPPPPPDTTVPAATATVQGWQQPRPPPPGTIVPAATAAGQGWQQPPPQQQRAIALAAVAPTRQQQPHQQQGGAITPAATTAVGWQQRPPQRQRTITPPAAPIGTGGQQRPQQQVITVPSATGLAWPQQAAAVPVVAPTAGPQQPRPQQQGAIVAAATWPQQPQQQGAIVPGAWPQQPQQQGWPQQEGYVVPAAWPPQPQQWPQQQRAVVPAAWPHQAQQWPQQQHAAVWQQHPQQWPQQSQHQGVIVAAAWPQQPQQQAGVVPAAAATGMVQQQRPQQQGAIVHAAAATGLGWPQHQQHQQQQRVVVPAAWPQQQGAIVPTAAATGLAWKQQPQQSGDGQRPSKRAIVQHIRPPPRPDSGSYGTKCIVKANHFFTELLCTNIDVYHYDVTITPKTCRVTHRTIMKNLVHLYKRSHLGDRLPAYDGQKSLYTTGPFPFTLQEFSVGVLVDDEDDIVGTNTDTASGVPTKERLFKVVIKFASRANLENLRLFLQGRQSETPQEAVQVLDIVLSQLPSSRYCPVGRAFYSPIFGRRQSLGDGVESWRGFYQSIRPTQMGLSLNVDISSTAFIEPLPVVEFVTRLLNPDVLNKPLSDADRTKIKNTLRGVKVQVTHRGIMRRKYRISGLTPQATCDLFFPVDAQGTMKSLVQYFQETYGFTIQQSLWPCLQVGSRQRPSFLPMEVCRIAEGQNYSKILNEKQIIAQLKVTCQRPDDREKDILQTVQHNAYQEDPYSDEFGIRVTGQLASVEARVLPPPWLKYNDTGEETNCLPHIGQWNMVNKKMVNGGMVNNWMCINFSRTVQDSVASAFCNEIAQTCNNAGMVYSLEPVIPLYSARPDQVEYVLKGRYHDCITRLHPRRQNLDLLIVILPDNNGSLYGDIKRICETDLGLVTQCCLTKQVFRKNKQYMASLALKINVKVGGRNTVLVDALWRRIPWLSDRPTIIFGADVTHPHPGESASPSIAAVVASQDWPEVTKYSGLVSAQAHRQELIQDLYKVSHDPVRGTVTGGMVKELLISFRAATGYRPERIIFYRDGVSEGQFYQVLFFELDAIRKACAALEPNYQPPVTFVVVQKRHHTKLFPDDHANNLAVDSSGNILPGTVVDSKICHPTEFDFFLCSHAGIQGTSHPAHYHVLWDENHFTADGLQSLTYNLCYTYARCTRAVSIVPPAYYAHLAAFRARFYMEPEKSSSGSNNVADRGETLGNAGAWGAKSQAAKTTPKPLPALKENVKRVMFYC